ncbi:MAG: hypothetical protein JNL54_21335 [Kineosporiaceae bacterium]|nr:hypothetical protein [Kineosporiaceae bacterium]
MIPFFVSRAGATALVGLSILYGAVIALLGALAPSALEPFALGGALGVGVLWAIRSMLVRATDRQDRG